MAPQIGISDLIPGLTGAMEADGIMPCWFQCWDWLLFVSHGFPHICIWGGAGTVDPKDLGLWTLTDASVRPSVIPCGESEANYLIP